MKNIIKTLLIITFFLNSNDLFNQEIVSQITLDTLLFTLNTDNIQYGLEPSEFKFPNYNYRDSNQFYTRSYSVNSFSRNDSLFAFILNSGGITLPVDTANNKFKNKVFLNFIYYTENIRQFDIYLKFRDIPGFLLLEEVTPSIDLTFQKPISSYLNNSKILTYSPLDTLKPTNLVVEKIKIVGKKTSKKAKFIIGELKIFDSHLKYINPHAWRQYAKPIHSYLLLDESFALSNLYGSFLLKGTSDSTATMQVVDSVIIQILEQYPNYEERGLLKDTILSKYKQIIANSNNLDEYYIALNELMLNFNDLHFRIDYYNKNASANTNHKRITNPIYLYNILGEFEVCAVFDTTLNVSVGDKLLSINGVEIEKLIEKYSEYVYANKPEAKIQKVLQKLFVHLYNSFGDSISLNFATKLDSAYTLVLKEKHFINNRNICIPANFRSPNEYVYEEHNDVCYIKLGLLDDKEAIPFFLSYKDSIAKTDAIVMDLRSNVGSDHSILYVMSLFLEKPFPCFTTSIENCFLAIPQNHSYETFIVKPNFYTFKQPTVFIANSRTTCGGEILIEVLKQSNNFDVIATTTTAGAAQHLKKINLPESKHLSEVTLTYYTALTLINKINIDEQSGIYPNIKTYFSSYNDLAPYNDKLKKLAINYLKRN